MISSKQLLTKTGVSRATLNNYIKRGLLSRPIVRSGEDGENLLGYFPDAALSRIENIKRLRASGRNLAEIAHLLAANPEAADEETPTGRAILPFPGSEGAAAGGEVTTTPRKPGGALSLSLDETVYPAYMFNYRLELTWYNEAARAEMLGKFSHLPAGSNERNILPMLRIGTIGWGEPAATDFLRAHLALVKKRFTRETFIAMLRHSPMEDQQFFLGLYEEAADLQAGHAAATRISLPMKLGPGAPRDHDLIATYFRKGILAVCAPASETAGSLGEFLSRRDIVIRHLLKNRLPVLTPFAVLIADLQGSTRICSELPPEEYFELINEIWSAMDPIFRKYFATRGKHVGDGMLYYFFPQAEGNHVFNAVHCAHDLREMMREISARWQVRKKWFVELFLNIGIHEGTEWLGVFESANSIEFAVLGDTINQAARVSELARQGAIWATKNTIGKLSFEERNRLQYGVKRQGIDDREVLVENTFAQIDSLVDFNTRPKMRDVANLTVTEVVSLH